MKQKPYRWVSLSDLHRADFQISVSKDTEKNLSVKSVRYQGSEITLRAFEKALWAIGIDTRAHPLLVQYNKHTTVLSQPVETFRFGSVERADKQWLESGYASEEVLLYTSNWSDIGEVAHSLQTGNAKGF